MNGESGELAIVTKNLKIKLTEPEVIERATEMAKAVAEWNRVDAERAEVARGFKERLAGIDSRVQDLKTVVLEAAEFRDVEVTIERDLFAKRVITRLASTGEVVEERPMEEHDRQLELQVAAQQASEGGEVIPLTGGKRDDRTEEQRLAETPEEAEEMRAARLAGDDARLTGEDDTSEFSDGPKTAELPVVAADDEKLVF